MSDKKDLSFEQIEVLQVTRNDEITYTFRCTRPENIKWETGTNGHFSLKPPTGVKETDKEFQRHMSIVSHGDEPFLEFTTRIRPEASDFKQKLSRMRKGDKLLVYGLNNRMPLIRENHHLVFVTMGVAISTCRPFIMDLEKESRGILSLSILNIDKKGKSYYQKQTEEHSGSGVDFQFFSNRTDLYKGIDRILSRPDNYFYLIGSDQFLIETGRYLLDKGIKDDEIAIDKKYGVLEMIKRSVKS